MYSQDFVSGLQSVDFSLNKTFLSFALFIGVFTVAYGGFFYQKYTSSQDKSETTAMAESPVQAVVSASVDHDHSSPTEILTTDIGHQSTQQPANKKLASSGKYKLKNQAQNTPDSSSDIDDQIESGRHNMVTYKSQTSSSSARSNLSAFSYTTSASNNVLQTSSTAISNGIADNISTASEISSDTSSRQTISATTSGNSQDSTTASSANDIAPSLNNTVNDVTTPDTDLLATPNCPVQLANGSTKADADAMRQSYGCRYLKYCRNLNDGKKGFTCWWGFYSS